MIRALYTAASGMMVESQKLDVLTNNLANGQTPGYKAVDLVRASQSAGPAVPRSDIQTAFAEQFHSPVPGQLRPTGVPFDFALEGTGYFAVETKGGTAYTRNGHFRRHADGSLTDGAGNAVLGQKGPVQLPNTADVTVAEDGTLFAGSKRVDRLKVVEFADPRTLRSSGASLVYPTAAAVPEASEARVLGGTLEDSNVSTVSEMARMVEATRAFESYQKVIQTVMDDITGAAVNRIGRVA